MILGNPFFYLGFVLGGYLNFSLLSYGIIGLIIALIYVQLNPNFAKKDMLSSNVGSISTAELADDELEIFRRITPSRVLRRQDRGWRN